MLLWQRSKVCFRDGLGSKKIYQGWVWHYLGCSGRIALGRPSPGQENSPQKINFYPGRFKKISSGRIKKYRGQSRVYSKLGVGDSPPLVLTPVSINQRIGPGGPSFHSTQAPAPKSHYLRSTAARRACLHSRWPNDRFKKPPPPFKKSPSIE